ncbi:peroxiredoxin family protein [Chitinophaga defluvii]|uniref:TlpA disulfide reductase family protein n=1 Tax=Chitinophaga defluvii TaxID=3163343 RepID=A0ABV2TCD3_9BACT
MITANAQDYKDNTPKVGDTIQNHSFKEVRNFPNNVKSISDFRGKWLVIDFWSMNCSGCIQGFPVMDKLQQQFKGQVQVIMAANVNPIRKGSLASHLRLFELQSKSHNLTVAFEFDSLFAKQMNMNNHLVPVIFVIDPSGVVRTKGYKMDSLTLSNIIKGEKVTYKLSSADHVAKGYNYKLPLMTNGIQANGDLDTNFVFRSLLAIWNENTSEANCHGFDDSKKALFKGRAEALGFDLGGLLRIAYTGKPSWGPGDSLYVQLSQDVINETNRRNLLDGKYLQIDTAGIDYNKKRKIIGVNMFSYSIINKNPGTTKAQLRQSMLKDVEGYFNIETKIEKRKVKVWKLVIIDSNLSKNLRSKGGQSEMLLKGITDGEGYRLTNYSIDQIVINSLLLLPIRSIDQSNHYTPIIINATGINFNIDLNLHANMYDLNSVRKSLNNFGLDLVPAEDFINAIVVSDRK